MALIFSFQYLSDLVTPALRSRSTILLIAVNRDLPKGHIRAHTNGITHLLEVVRSLVEARLDLGERFL
jgi:hypothetical protein